MKMPISHIWKPNECALSIFGISMRSPKPVLRWNGGLMQSPRPSQTGDGGGDQIYCGELSGLASSAAGRMQARS